VTLYLRGKRVRAGKRRDPDRRYVWVFELCADLDAKVSVARFYCQDTEIDKQKALRFIETWGQQQNIAIGNPEEWSLGTRVEP